MAMTDEVRDTETFNRVGTFPTEAEAETFLTDALRENGQSVVGDLAIVGYADADAEPEMVLAGATYVVQQSVPA
jgi:hypothetical protein